MNTYIQKYGLSKTILQRNNQTEKHEMEWMGDYDGKNAKLHLHMNDNGNMKEIQMKFDKNDLNDLLNVPVNNTSLEKRLIRDFLRVTTHKKRKTRRNLKTKFRKSRKTL